MIHWDHQPTFRDSLFASVAFSVFLMLESFLAGCSTKKDESYKSPPGYDFSKPYVYKMPDILDEISGVTYYPKDSSVFAIQDEKGLLFKIHLNTNPLQIEQWKFSSSGDYEDVALADSNFYVLKSKGVIDKLKFSTGDSIELQHFKVPQKTKNEFETLYYDSSLHRLIVICKNCEGDPKNQVTAWAFDPSTNSFSPAFSIETSKIRQAFGESDKSRFKPSAAAVDPLTGELYIVASVNHALVILNKDHSVKATYNINRSLFKQPEGLTFTPKGDLIISNESAEKGTAADILFFKYSKPKQR
jgi:uncharacterized protein YjiK